MHTRTSTEHIESLVRQMIRTIHVPYSFRRLTTIVTNYLDESGIHRGSQLVALGGYSILPDDWPPFEVEFRSLLDSFQLPTLHMNEFVPPDGDYCRIPIAERVSLFKRLIELIERHTQFGVAVGVDSAAYHSACSSVEEVISAYGFCFMGIAAINAIWGEQMQYADRISYMLGSGAPHAGDIGQGFDVMKSFQRAEIIDFRVGTMAFGDDDDFGALQAADVLVYLFRNDELGVIQPYQEELFKELCAAKKHVLFMIPRDLLEEFAKFYPLLLEEVADFKSRGMKATKQRRMDLLRRITERIDATKHRPS